jgi:hypothetical protein
MPTSCTCCLGQSGRKDAKLFVGVWCPADEDRCKYILTWACIRQPPNLTISLTRSLPFSSKTNPCSPPPAKKSLTLSLTFNANKTTRPQTTKALTLLQQWDPMESATRTPSRPICTIYKRPSSPRPSAASSSRRSRCLGRERLYVRGRRAGR